MESTDTSERVTQALAMLKSELMEIREQDVGLMKQLLKINDTIRQLSPNKENCKAPLQPGYTRRHSAGDVTSASSRRQRYLNAYLSRRRGSCGSSDESLSSGSLSSIEEITTATENCSIETESEETEDVSLNGISESEDSLSKSPPCSFKSDCTPLSNSRRLSLQYTTTDEHVLISNIKVWKYKQSRSLENVKYL